MEWGPNLGLVLTLTEVIAWSVADVMMFVDLRRVSICYCLCLFRFVCKRLHVWKSSVSTGYDNLVYSQPGL